jgi:hypothetical protein
MGFTDKVFDQPIHHHGKYQLAIEQNQCLNSNMQALLREHKVQYVVPRFIFGRL